MYPLPRKGLRPLSSAAPIRDFPRERRNTPLIFYRRIVTSFSLFSPYCRVLTFNGSFPGLKRSRSVCCRDRAGRRRVPDLVGGVAARTMKGHGWKSTREEQDKKIIRQEQSDKQEEVRGGWSGELIGIVRGERRGRKTSLKPRPDTSGCVVRYGGASEGYLLCTFLRDSAFFKVFRKVG